MMATVLERNNNLNISRVSYTSERVPLLNRYSTLTVSNRCSPSRDAPRKVADFHYDLSIATAIPRDIGTSNSISECPCTSAGILLDFDIVRAINGMDGAAETSRRQTPVPIFMAIDLLKHSGDPEYSEDSEIPIPSCLYRHDAESFFYVLVWICCNYDKGEQVDNVRLKWDADSYLDVARRKEDFFKTMYLRLTPIYMPLWKPWFLHMQFHIDRGHNKLEMWKSDVRFAKMFLEGYSEDNVLMDVNKRLELYEENVKKMEELKDTSVLIDLFGFVTYELFRYILEKFECN